jgi:hypothetical protein
MNEPIRVRVITIADDDWMNGGDNADHLTTILVINGTFHHLEAIRICEDQDGRQHAADPAFEESVEAMYQIGGDGPFDTVYIKGDSYLLVSIPFQ